MSDFRTTIADFGARWAALKPRDGPSGNPAVVLAQLEDAAHALADLQQEAERLTRVRRQALRATAS